MKDLTLTVGLTIPIERYAPLKVGASATEIKCKSESDEALFTRTFEKLNKILEATIALETSKYLRIKDDIGLAGYSIALAEELALTDNQFVRDFLSMIKAKNDTKPKGNEENV